MNKSTKTKTVPPEVVIAAATDLAMGKGRREVIYKHGVSQRDVEVLRRLSSYELEDFREGLRASLRSLQTDLLAEIKTRLPHIPAGQLAVSYGILSDKLALLDGAVAATTVHNQTNIAIMGMTKADLREALVGGIKPKVEKQADGPAF